MYFGDPFFRGRHEGEVRVEYLIELVKSLERIFIKDIKIQHRLAERATKIHLDTKSTLGHQLDDPKTRLEHESIAERVSVFLGRKLLMLIEVEPFIWPVR